MTDDRSSPPRVRVYLCECGPIIKDALDLDRLQESLAGLAGIEAVVRHSTLCSQEGRAWMQADLQASPGSRVVVAGCSPREHEATFMDVLRASGSNPYLLAMANVREQCTWVTEDRDEAGGKALALIRAAAARAAAQEPLEERDIECNPDVLVIGAGVAGLSAAHMLARADRRVVLVERTPAIGGRSALLGDIFPTLECASCVLEPLMDEVLHDDSVEVLTYSEVEQVLGYLGSFKVGIRKRARRVDPDGCYGCSSCHAACPVEVPSLFDEGLRTRKAIYIPYEGALPSVSLIDDEACLALTGRQCDACVTACPFGNIDLTAADEILEREVGAVIVATGAEAELLEGVSVPDRVVSSMVLERLISSAGPTSGEIRLPGMEALRSIALIQCVDENCTGPAASCSKICCMAFSKYVQQIHEKLPDCRIHQILWERCAGGKGYREFAARADRTEGLEQSWLERYDIIEVPVQEGDAVLVRYTYEGKPVEVSVDMAVVAPPLRGARGARDLAAMLRVDLDDQGFLVEENGHLASFRTRVKGVQTAGCARGAADIQESCAQGAAAAGDVLSALVPGRRIRVEARAAHVQKERCGGCRTCVLTCPYKAITYDEEGRSAFVNDVLCRGCGSCAAACPTAAISARHFSDNQIRVEILAHMDDARQAKMRKE
ncbi:MAG: CoB--CoM heterodisulfide reductase iron-sulfur subunit A family protein [Deltaproteobacteria bacterium]|nr:CoB--CoM heterodisulfide reductase iron-sulfur subunit A family protein [Deltaproteobacteria bacterium]